MKKKFKDKTLDCAKAKDKEYYLREDDGFVFRVRPTGHKSFYHIFDFAGKRQRILIGNYPDMGLADAREIHSDHRKVLRRGINPKTIKENLIKPSEEPTSPPLTVASLAKTWLEEFSEKNHSEKWANTLRLAVEKDIIPDWGDNLASDLKRKDALSIIGLKATSAPGQSKNLLKAMRQMFSYAVDHELLEFNPFLNVKSKSIPALASVHRDRVISDSELKHFWSMLGTCGGSVSTILTLRLILLTAQRPGEVAGMRWDELGWGEGKPFCNTCRRCAWWTIPPERSKNKKENRVYLPPFVVELIKTFGCADSEYVCLNIDPNAVAYHVRREVPSVGKVPFYGLDRWTPHDLRRTAATGLSRLGCIDEIVDAILNHQKQGVIKVYNRNKYDDEKRDWLSIWADYICAITSLKG